MIKLLSQDPLQDWIQNRTVQDLLCSWFPLSSTTRSVRSFPLDGIFARFVTGTFVCFGIRSDPTQYAKCVFRPVGRGLTAYSRKSYVILYWVFNITSWIWCQTGAGIEGGRLVFVCLWIVLKITCILHCWQNQSLARWAEADLIADQTGFSMPKSLSVRVWKHFAIRSASKNIQSRHWGCPDFIKNLRSYLTKYNFVLVIFAFRADWNLLNLVRKTLICSSSFLLERMTPSK